MVIQCYRCFEVACIVTNLAHMHTARNTIVHVPVIHVQYNDEPATSTSSQQWECQTAGCNVTKVKIELKFDHYIIRMHKYFIILITSNLKSSVG